VHIADRQRVGQVIVPIPLSAVATMTPTELADTYAPIALATAKEHGATLVGTPELLRLEQILPRVTDPNLGAIIRDATASAFLLATMVPHDWDDFDAGRFHVTEHVTQPVTRPLPHGVPRDN